MYSGYSCDQTLGDAYVSAAPDRRTTAEQEVRRGHPQALLPRHGVRRAGRRSGLVRPRQRCLARALPHARADLRPAVRGVHRAPRPVDLLDGHASLAAGEARRRRDSSTGDRPGGCGGPARPLDRLLHRHRIRLDRDRRATRQVGAGDAPHDQGHQARRRPLRRRRPGLAALELCDCGVGAGDRTRALPSTAVARQEDRPLLRRVRSGRPCARRHRPTDDKGRDARLPAVVCAEAGRHPRHGDVHRPRPADGAGRGRLGDPRHAAQVGGADGGAHQPEHRRTHCHGAQRCGPSSTG